MICRSKKCQQNSYLVKPSGMKNENHCYEKSLDSQNKPKNPTFSFSFPLKLCNINQHNL